MSPHPYCAPPPSPFYVFKLGSSVHVCVEQCSFPVSGQGSWSRHKIALLAHCLFLFLSFPSHACVVKYPNLRVLGFWVLPSHPFKSTFSQQHRSNVHSSGHWLWRGPVVLLLPPLPETPEVDRAALPGGATARERSARQGFPFQSSPALTPSTRLGLQELGAQCSGAGALVTHELCSLPPSPWRGRLRGGVEKLSRGKARD